MKPMPLVPHHVTGGFYVHTEYSPYSDCNSSVFITKHSSSILPDCLSSNRRSFTRLDYQSEQYICLWWILCRIQPYQVCINDTRSIFNYCSASTYAAGFAHVRCWCQGVKVARQCFRRKYIIIKSCRGYRVTSLQPDLAQHHYKIEVSTDGSSWTTLSTKVFDTVTAGSSMFSDPVQCTGSLTRYYRYLACNTAGKCSTPSAVQKLTCWCSELNCRGLCICPSETLELLNDLKF